MSSKLTILSPGGYRVVLKVNTNSALCLPLEKSCSLFGLEASWFGLKHLKRCLDVSSTVRQSNVPNNGTLEMYRLDKERVASLVRIALSLPDGTRHTGVYAASVCLWDVLYAAEAEGSTIPLCYPGGTDTLPCVEYCKVRVMGEEELRSKSLMNLGILSGSAILRFWIVGLEDVPKTICEDVVVLKAHRLTESSPALVCVTNKPESKSNSAETPVFPSPQSSVFADSPLSDPYLSSVMKTPWSFDQQIEEEEKRRKQDDEEQNPPLFRNPDGWEYHKGPFENINLQALLTQAVMPAVPPEEDYIAQFNLLRSEKTGKPLDSSDDISEVVPTPAPPTDPLQIQTPAQRVYVDACPRDTCVFHLDMNEYSEVKPAEVEDSFFQPSANEVMARQSSLSHEVTQFHESPLSTQAYKRNREGFQADKYERTIIRIVLPNRLVLQGIFRSGEPVKALIGYIRNCSAEPKAKFHLFTTPPKKIIKNGKVTFKEANLVPACNVYLALEEGEEGFFLKENLLDQVSTQLDADIRSCKERGAVAPSPAPVYTHLSIGSGGEGKIGKPRSRNTNQGKPKWFKVGK